MAPGRLLCPAATKLPAPAERLACGAGVVVAVGAGEGVAVRVGLGEDSRAGVTDSRMVLEAGGSAGASRGRAVPRAIQALPPPSTSTRVARSSRRERAGPGVAIRMAGPGIGLYGG